MGILANLLNLGITKILRSKEHLPAGEEVACLLCEALRPSAMVWNDFGARNVVQL